LAHLAAGLGARVMTGVGSSTTMLVVAGREPFGRATRASAAFLKAEELRREGTPLRILPSDALRTIAARA
jgi:DNA polymerase-3 subunit epsilon